MARPAGGTCGEAASERAALKTPDVDAAELRLSSRRCGDCDGVPRLASSNCGTAAAVAGAWALPPRSPKADSETGPLPTCKAWAKWNGMSKVILILCMGPFAPSIRSKVTCGNMEPAGQFWKPPASAPADWCETTW